MTIRIWVQRTWTKRSHLDSKSITVYDPHITPCLFPMMTLVPCFLCPLFLPSLPDIQPVYVLCALPCTARILPPCLFPNDVFVHLFSLSFVPSIIARHSARVCPLCITVYGPHITPCLFPNDDFGTLFSLSFVPSIIARHSARVCPLCITVYGPHITPCLFPNDAFVRLFSLSFVPSIIARHSARVCPLCITVYGPHITPCLLPNDDTCFTLIS